MSARVTGSTGKEAAPVGRLTAALAVARVLKACSAYPYPNGIAGRLEADPITVEKIDAALGEWEAPAVEILAACGHWFGNPETHEDWPESARHAISYWLSDSARGLARVHEVLETMRSEIKKDGPRC